jgi:hypothetical protein
MVDLGSLEPDMDTRERVLSKGACMFLPSAIIPSIPKRITE